MPANLQINGRETVASVGTSLFDGAESLGVQVPTSCRKNGKCKECVVEVAQGMALLSPPDAAEEHLHGAFRLSCCARIIADEGEIRCHTMRRGQMRVERHAYQLPLAAQTPTLDPAVTRDGRRILMDGEHIADSDGPIYGIAADIGTTTVVLRLLNLETGELVADASFENPQRFGGAEVMARIQYDTDHKGRLLMRTLAGYLSRAIEEFPVEPHDIYEMVVVGNSTMRDMFFRQSVYTIGQTPYHSITEIEAAEGKRTTTALVDDARGCLLPIHPRARVWGAPIISGHVGADAAACMLAIDLSREDRLVAIMDIGTNTELILGNKDRIVAASCPAGPAFEGGAITCGMPGLEGAVEGVAFDEDAADGVNPWRLTVIGDVPPDGICGSGLVDLMSELVRTEQMNRMGRFEHPGEPVVLDAQRQIVFTEGDVNELAQAKGANVAGLHIALAHYGVSFDDLDVFYLAGGFGRHLQIDAARRIGLIPNLPDEKIIQVGNAAIEGATIALLSRSKRDELERLVRRVEHCRLETHPAFFDYFVEGCQFKPLESADQAAR